VQKEGLETAGGGTLEIRIMVGSGGKKTKPVYKPG